MLKNDIKKSVIICFYTRLIAWKDCDSSLSSAARVQLDTRVQHDIELLSIEDITF